MIRLNKADFNKLGLKDQIDFVNIELEKKSLTKISEEIKVSRKTLRNRFDKFGYVYDKQSNKYIIKSNRNDEEDSNNTNNTFVLFDKIESLERRIKGLEDKINKSETELIELKEINIKSLEGETVSRCYRLNKEVQNEFSSFCKKNSNYKVQDILGSALVEFMEKYK